ncbi:PRA1 family protein D [Bienertia sinuspersici]
MSKPLSTRDSSTAFDTKPCPKFFDINSLSPVSLSEASARLNFKLSHFRITYISVFLIIFFLTLALRPLSPLRFQCFSRLTNLVWSIVISGVVV